MVLDVRQLLIAALRDPDVASALRDALGASSPDTWMSLDAAAEIAGVEPRVIRDAGRVGKIVLGSAGGQPRVTRRELDRWLSTAPIKKPRKPKADVETKAANDTRAKSLTREDLGRDLVERATAKRSR